MKCVAIISVRASRTPPRTAASPFPASHRTPAPDCRASVDHLQHLGGRGLLFQRLPLFGQQPRVLDRDHRLIGEGADKFDLPVGERLDPLAREHDDSDRFTLAQQRHAERGPLLAKPDGHLRIARNGGHVVNMHGAALSRLLLRAQSASPVECAIGPSAF